MLIESKAFDRSCVAMVPPPEAMALLIFMKESRMPLSGRPPVRWPPLPRVSCIHFLLNLTMLLMPRRQHTDAEEMGRKSLEPGFGIVATLTSVQISGSLPLS